MVKFLLQRMVVGENLKSKIIFFSFNSKKFTCFCAYPQPALSFSSCAVTGVWRRTTAYDGVWRRRLTDMDGAGSRGGPYRIFCTFYHYLKNCSFVIIFL